MEHMIEFTTGDLETVSSESTCTGSNRSGSDLDGVGNRVTNMFLEGGGWASNGGNSARRAVNGVSVLTVCQTGQRGG